MTRPDGVHHIALCTARMKEQIAFFTDVLGMELVALYWMHGVDGAWHGFLKLNESCSIALVSAPGVAEIEIEVGRTHAGNPGAPCAAGTLQHLALNAASEADLLQLRDRIRSRGINVIGPVDHGFCKSIYFAGLEHLSLEISTSAEPIDPRAWIDPEVVALAGISAEELAHYKAPAPYAAPDHPVPQPPIDPEKPHMSYPERAYRRMMETPDAEFSARSSWPDPPVAVG